MSSYTNSIFTHISEKLKGLLDQKYPEHGLTLEILVAQLGEAPNLQMGHVAFACFPLAKVCRTAPPKIAGELAELFSSDNVILKAQAQGPYLNFFLNPKGIGELVLAKIHNHSFFEQSLISQQDKEKWMIEYSQPNTHKLMHVGHMRNLCLGNALVRMIRYTGRDLLSVTYPGDVGTHVAKCLWYLDKHNKDPFPKENQGAWLGKMYSLANDLLEKERGGANEETNRQELTAILKQLHDHNGAFYDLWKETKLWSVELMKEAYAWADVEFDHWFWESEVDAPSIAFAKELYEKGHLIEDQGAIGMKLEEEKLGFCILIKSDGNGLYSTKDIQLAKDKFEHFGVNRSIYIVDERQSFHFKQVFKVLEKIGFEEAKECYHLQYQMVELPGGAMSSRKGNIIPLMTLVSQMQEKIQKDYLNKYLEDSESDWSEEEIKKTAKQIANGAIKYGMIRVDNNRKIVFDIDEWLKLDGETGPYLQYVYARINSLSKKFSFDPNKEVDWQLLVASQETALLVKLIRFNDVVLSGVKNLQTIHLCSYLYELGKLFNAFYAECPIGKVESTILQNTRLSLAQATGVAMRNGLALLGIPVPDRM